MSKMVLHDFYCINCGKRAISIFRNNGHLHSKNHRKKMYCPYCKKEVNMIEVQDENDISNFLEDFRNGSYKTEAEISLSVTMKGF